MVFTGILYSLLLMYFIPTPIFNNVVLHCIILGTVFGLTNFMMTVLFYKRLEKLKKLNQHLKDSLMTDTLTGLLNRRALDQDIKNVDDSQLYSIIFLDIDNFRNFNNQFGHDIGDNVLKKVGETIKACTRTTDRAYRYGGE